MSLSEIFSLFGQRAYRRYEHKALENILSSNREIVFETGGDREAKGFAVGFSY